MNNLALFGLVLAPNLEGYMPFLPAITIFLAIGAVATFKPGISKAASSGIVSPTHLGLVAVMAAQVVLLFAFAGKHEMVVRSGSEIILAVHSYDPYDMFRGNYLRIQYDISRLSSTKIKFISDAPFKRDDTVYVVLEESNPQWVPDAVYDHVPSLKANQVALKGRVENAFGKELNVHYGLEQYFYSDGKQLHVNKGSLAKIKVDHNGDAVLTELIP